ncbi:RNase A-like domain-containing protein [Yersinia pestis]|nr:hypothetical protein [Yersinia pestis]MBF4413627.1 hypothetical protein [Yersinia pestis subsp. pestis]QQD42452.1 hypothetical protein AH66_000720 [Yersinia pestis EV NIIEG]MBD3447088.1 hypothetical protein [Yersinia pestis]MBD3452341.1 hypothetical protein [Yersinia pestis]
MNHFVGHVIGCGVRRGELAGTKLTKFRIVIRFEAFHGKPYYILTAYPMF